MDDLAELKAAREKVAELERKIAEEVQQKMAALGMTETKMPKQKRPRRTKAQIAADNAKVADV